MSIRVKVLTISTFKENGIYANEIMRKVNLTIPFSEAFDLTRKALDLLGIKYLTDKDNYTINAKKGFSLFSWGEEIQISFARQRNFTVISIESISSGQLISWGRNESNELEIERTIKKLSKDI